MTLPFKLGDKAVILGYQIPSSNYHRLIELCDVEYIKAKGFTISEFEGQIVAYTYNPTYPDFKKLKLFLCFETMPNLDINLNFLDDGEIQFYQNDFDIIQSLEKGILGKFKDYKNLYLDVFYFKDYIYNVIPQKRKPENDFCKCRSCKLFFYMAEPDNAGDNMFRCGECKNNPLREFY